MESSGLWKVVGRMVTVGKADKREDKGLTAFLAALLEGGLVCLRGDT